MKIKIISLVLVMAALAGLANCAGSGSSFDDIVANRRSVRSYDKSKKISDEQIRILIATTQEAPSWANVQATRYYTVMSDDMLNKVLPSMLTNQEKASTAPVLIVTTYKRGLSGFFDGKATNELGDTWGAFDAGLSNAFLVLKAKEMGFDTLIMGLRDAEGLKKALDIPSDETVMSVVALGYGTQSPKRPERKPLYDILKIK
ncbi:MAG: nitroreductase family protein [Bacteroidaceae bacterium]|nr:nitroreductase family protein [Bacteroidaceae bacterium]